MTEPATINSVLQALQNWYKAQWINALDLNFARFIASQGEQSPAVILLAALLSHQVGRGHVCLPLQQLLDDPQPLLNLPPAHPSNAIESLLLEHAPSQPAQLLASCNVKALLEEGALAAGSLTISSASSGATESANDNKPLVLVEGSHQALYLRRYWRYEQHIRAQLQTRMKQPAPAYSVGNGVAPLKEALEQLFPAQSSDREGTQSVNWQKLACANAMRSGFSVITGGPGTGKTYTVVRLLALMQKLSSRALRIRLAAPTGKAAARLKESIQGALKTLQAEPDLAGWQEALQRVDSTSSTLHRLLGVQQGTRNFRHHRSNLLALDVLVVDEASMVDIELMSALLDALPANAQLVLLGDKDQLASVEAGAMLGQLCDGAQAGGYDDESWAFFSQFEHHPLPIELHNPEGPHHLQHVVMLRESRRFNDRSGIGKLAAALNIGAMDEVNKVLQDDGYQDVASLSVQTQSKELDIEGLRALCVKGFAQYLQTIRERPSAQDGEATVNEWAQQVLKSYASFQLLSPIREGDFGVEGLNQQVESWLRSSLKALTEQPDSLEQSQWYEGRPVMVTENDYSLNLRNGDVGLVLRSPADGRLRVVFIDSDGKLRWIMPSRLRQVETVFAMTVHKSQGSEFNHTVLVLPQQDNPVLSRELIYTGVTRAKNQLTLVVPNFSVLQASVARPTIRSGGLNV